MTLNKNDFKQWIITLRNDFHKYPEVSTLEKRTTQQICDVLKTLDVKVRKFDDLTGVVGLLQGVKKCSGENNKTIALRADIDALPMQELGNRSYKSKNNGVMQ